MTPTQRLQEKMSALPDRFKQTQGQPGGLRSISPQSRVQSYKQLQPYAPAATREKFFGDRFVPTERLERRGTQERLLDEFKDKYTYQQPGTNLYQMKPGAPTSLSQYTQDLAREYGPTPREVLGDIGYGIRSIGSALGDRIAQGNIGFFGAAKEIVSNLYNKAVQESKDTLDMLKKNVISTKSDIKQEIIDRGKDKAPYTWNQVNNEIQEEAGVNLDLSLLNATQRATYDMLTTKNNPLSHEEALAQVKQQFTDNRSLDERLQDITKKRNGGIVSLIR